LIGFYFQSELTAALERNAARPEIERISEKGVHGTYARLQLPSLPEGFDELYDVYLREGGGFSVKAWAEGEIAEPAVGEQSKERTDEI
jgi:hypothetical protein